MLLVRAKEMSRNSRNLEPLVDNNNYRTRSADIMDNLEPLVDNNYRTRSADIIDNLEPLVDNNYRTSADIMHNRVSPRKIVDNYDDRSSPGETAGKRNNGGSSGGTADILDIRGSPRRKAGTRGSPGGTSGNRTNCSIK